MIQIWQIILITILAFIGIIDSLTFTIGLGRPILAGTLTGLIMGDVAMGMGIGATLELMQLGIGTYGGASMPDYFTGSIVGTVFAITSGQGLDFGLSLAVPVGLLMIQLDVLARSLNVFFQHRIEAAIERMDLRAVERNVWLGALPWGLSRALPVIIMLIFGQGVVDAILNYSPEWLINGLQVAGGLLPAVGFAILLKYLNLKVNFPFLIIGFVLASYFDITVMGVALFGLAIAMIVYQNDMRRHREVATAATAAPAGGATTVYAPTSNVGDLDDDEYEEQ